MATRRAKHVIRKFKLPDFLGCEETALNALRDLGLLHFYSMTRHGRAQVVDEDEVVALQDAAREAGSLEALIEKARAAKGVVS